jgi:hypothetical protein
MENVYFKVIWYMYFTAIWYSLWSFGNIVIIWYVFHRFGILCREKSGNPGRVRSVFRNLEAKL